MKRLYTLLFLSFALQTALSGQAVLTAPEHITDKVFQRYEMEHAPKPTTGPNQVWDYRGAALIRPFTGQNMRYKVFREQDSLYIYATDGQTAQYTSYKNGRHSISQKEGNNYRLVYGQPHILMQYPLSFKTSFSSESKALETCPQHLTVPLQTRSESQVVGYGNLVLPNHKLIQEAFLVKTIYTSIQTKDTGGFYQEACRFYSSGMLFPLIEHIKTYRYSDNALLSEFMYYYQDEEMAMQSFSVDENTLNKTEQNPEKQTLSAVYPNPTGNRLEVKIPVEHETVVKLHIKNLSGQVFKSMAWTFKTPGDYRQTLYLNEYGLPVGTYLIQLDMNQTTETHKIEYIR